MSASFPWRLLETAGGRRARRREVREVRTPQENAGLLIVNPQEHSRLAFNVNRLRSDTTYWMPQPHAALGRRVSLDISNVEFIEPFGLVYLYWYLRHLGEATDDLEVILPRSADIQNYLQRMHLPECLGDMAHLRFEPRIDLGRIRETDLPGRLVELETFEVTDDDAVEDCAARTLEVIQSRDASIHSELLRLALTEVISNIEVHSETRAGALAVQRYTNPDRVHMAFGDGGVGIPASLRSAGFEGGDGQLIREALKEGVTSRGLGRGGTGLSDLVYEVRRHGSRMDIRSAQGHVTVWEEGEKVRDDCRAMPGTIIEVIW